MTDLTPHFSLEELVASDTATRLGIDNTPPPEVVDELRKTAGLLEQIRAILGVPLLVSSGYRCQALNRALKSQDTSAHIPGQAADFRAPSFGTPLDICHALQGHAQELGFDQLIHEFDAWVHVGRRSGTSRGQLLTIDNAGTRFGFN
jgi:hypothetical protein